MNRHVLYTLSCLSILIIGAIYTITLSIHYIELNNTPPVWDYANHLNNALSFYSFIQNGHIYEFFTYYTYYPPLYYWMTAFLWSVFGYTRYSIVILNSIYLLICLISIYRLTNNKYSILKRIEFIIFALGLFFVITSAGGRFYEYMLDIPSLVLIVLCFNAILKTFSEHKSSWVDPILIGIFFALSMLTKWHSIIYLILPMLWYGSALLKRRNWYGTYIYIAIILYGSGWWYFLHRDLLFPSWMAYTSGQAAVPFYSYVKYVYKRIPISLFWIIPASKTMLLKMKTLISFLYGKNRLLLLNKNHRIEILFILISIFPFCFLRVKDPRFIYPGIFLLSLYIFKNTVLKDPFKSSVFISISLFMFLSITLYYPTPNTSVQLVDRIRKYILETNPRSVGYYFEEDNESINFDTVSLINNEMKIINKSTVQFYFLNSFINKEDESRCDINDSIESIYVYSRIDTKNSNTVSFEKNCLLKTRSMFQYTRDIIINSDKISIYSRKVTNN